MSNVILPSEPTPEMLANTCDEQGRPAILKYTTPEERGQPYLMPRYIYRAMLAAAPPVPEDVVERVEKVAMLLALQDHEECFDEVTEAMVRALLGGRKKFRWQA